MKFDQIRHNDTTCYSKIQGEQLQVHFCKAVHPNCTAAGPSYPAESTDPADHHSPGRARGPGPIIAAPYLHFTQIQSKSTSEKEKHGKNTVSVMESVLLILFC